MESFNMMVLLVNGINGGSMDTCSMKSHTHHVHKACPTYTEVVSIDFSVFDE